MNEGVYNTSPGILTLALGDALPIASDAGPRGQVKELLDRARELIDAIYALAHWPPRDGDISAQLVEELKRTLLYAAEASDESAFAEHLRLRAESLTSNRFERAIEFGAVTDMPFELLLAPSPTYILPTRDRGLSATFAASVADPIQSELPEIDARVSALAERCIDESPVLIAGPTFAPPRYSICDLLWLAGGAAVPPFHFSHFLPEDEGVERATTKTVVYRNLFTLRFEKVSIPLVGDDASEVSADILAAEAPPILLRWLRAHDLAHSYFDQVCFASGLDDRILHGTREILADTLADALLLSEPGPTVTPTVLFAEMKRLARRDPGLFADAWAARVELSWFQERIGEPMLAACADLTAACLDLIAETLGRLGQPSPVSFERWVEQLAAAYIDATPPPPIDDVVPVLGPGRRARLTRHSPLPHCAHA